MAAPVNTQQKQFLKQGAEAKVCKEKFYDKNCVSKERFSKAYRHPSLDKALTLQRLKGEIRAMHKCRNLGSRIFLYFFSFARLKINYYNKVSDHYYFMYLGKKDDTWERGQALYRYLCI